MTIDEIRWLELPICCPHCGNHGEADGEWQANGWTPFRLIEEVVQSWLFTPVRDGEGLALIADAAQGAGPSTNLQFECMQCFELFPLPESAKVRFE